MRYLNATQAAKIIGVTDRTVRDWIAQGKLTAHHPAPNRLAIARTDVERIARERKQYDVSIPDASEIAERLASLEQKYQDLNQRYQELEARIALPSPVTSAPVREYKQPSTPSSTVTSAEKSLPPGAVHIRQFAKDHGVNENTFVTQIKKGIRGEIPPHSSHDHPTREGETVRYIEPSQQEGVFTFWRRHGVGFEE